MRDFGSNKYDVINYCMLLTRKRIEVNDFNSIDMGFVQRTRARKNPV